METTNKLTITIVPQDDKVVVTAQCGETQKMYTLIKGDKLVYNIDLTTQILLH